ncbi:MAG TPA: hypothetical protein VK009_27015 [Chloroflexota bacterium]|nr:hypothetical protein [Chloroflexota bacterium]
MASKQSERLEAEIERIDAGGDTWNSSVPVHEAARVKRPLDAILRVRFTADQIHQVEALASEAGVGPSTLVRMWVLDRLRAPVSR